MGYKESLEHSFCDESRLRQRVELRSQYCPTGNAHAVVIRHCHDAPSSWHTNTGCGVLTDCSTVARDVDHAEHRTEYACALTRRAAFCSIFCCASKPLDTSRRYIGTRLGRTTVASTFDAAISHFQHLQTDALETTKTCEQSRQSQVSNSSHRQQCASAAARSVWPALCHTDCARMGSPQRMRGQLHQAV